MKATCVLALCAMALLAGGARANDGGGYSGAGGRVFLARENPAVRMLSEDVFIQLPACRVRTRFVFRNDGPPTTVLMLFPENGYLNTATDEFIPEIKTRYTHFRYFHATVDGRPVRVRRIVQKQRGRDDMSYEYWWAKRVRFGRGQTRVVVNRYQGGLGWWPLGMPARTFQYILRTGATWKGRIGRARIVCDVSGIRDGGPFRVEPAGYRREGDRLIWEMRSFKPTERNDVNVCWIDGFANAMVNGRPVCDEEGWRMEWGMDNPVTPRRSGGDVWLPARLAAQWLGARFETCGPGRSVRLTRGERAAVVTVGSSRVMTGGGSQPMARRARIERGRIMAELTPLVRALGGTASFGQQGCMEARLPQVQTASEAIRGFRYNYTFGEEPGWRVWTCGKDGAWEERYASGFVNRFQEAGRAKVNGIGGMVLEDTSRNLLVFVPDRRSGSRALLFRLKSDTEWSTLGEMDDVR